MSITFTQYVESQTTAYMRSERARCAACKGKGYWDTGSLNLCGYCDGCYVIPISAPNYLGLLLLDSTRWG